MFYLVTILFGVGWILASVIRNYSNKRSPDVEWIGNSLFRVHLLSNFGELLKILLSINNWKFIVGWINYSGTIINQNICENKILNRESKSIVSNLPTIVKEQRIDGNRGVYLNTRSRFILRCFSINQFIKTQSNLIHKRYLTSIIENKIDHAILRFKMNPWFLTGFSDGEASFIVYVQKSKNVKIGWVTWLAFEINIIDKDLSILKDIMSYFGVGKIYHKSNGSCVYNVRSIEEISVIIAHFDKYPLLTQKQADFLLFKAVFEIIKSKDHLTEKGFHRVLGLKASINKGLSPELKKAFPNIIPIERPQLSCDSKVTEPNWLAGFTTAEGCFLVRIINKPNNNTQVLLQFKLCQHIRDEKLFRSIVDFLGCGRVYLNKRSVDFFITKFGDISGILIPLFLKYPVQGVKHFNFLDFVKVAEIKKSNSPLTEENISSIRNIKSGMNYGRS